MDEETNMDDDVELKLDKVEDDIAVSSHTVALSTQAILGNCCGEYHNLRADELGTLTCRA